MSQFSVIIPTRDRPKRLVECLQSFADLEYPVNSWELIVVNDGGTDSFAMITSELKQQLPLQLVDIEPAGPAAARNRGAKLASGDYLAFTDDDCYVSPDWLCYFAKGFADDAWDALGGQALNAFPDNKVAQTEQHLLSFLYDYMRDSANNALLLISNNVAYRRSVFEAIGGFDETFPWAAAEDLELSYRLIAGGYRQRYCPEAKVWHRHRLTWQGYINQQFRYGRGSHFFYKASKPTQMNGRIKPYSKTPFYVALAQSTWHSRVPLSIWLLLGVSQMAYRVGRVYQTLRARTGHT